MTEQEFEMERLLLQERTLQQKVDELNQQIKCLRTSMANYVIENGNFVTPDWKVRWQEPTMSASYDKHELTALVEDLIAAGDGEIAKMITDCLKSFTKAGYLKVEPVRKKKVAA